MTTNRQRNHQRRLLTWVLWGSLLAALLAGCTAAPPTPTATVPAATATESAPPAPSSPTATLPAADTPTSPPPPTPTATLSAASATPAVDAADGAVRFAVIGDYGQAGAGVAGVAALIRGWQVDLILTVGDNNYPAGSAETIDANIGQYFAEYIAPYTGSYGVGGEVNRFFPTLGNHDYDTANAQAYFDYFSLPGNERYYDFRQGAVHFFALNSDYREPDGVGMSSAQATWLREALAASDAPWKVVYFHTAPYSSGMQGSTDWMRWPFKAWGASLVLSGHDHSYERLEVDGLTYLVNGLGGGAIYGFVNILPESRMRYNEQYGALLIEADADTLTARFINTDGTEIDQVRLTSPAAAAPAAPVAETASRLPDGSQYAWQPYVGGLTRPVGLAYPQDGSGRLFVIEQPGQIRIMQGGTLLAKPFLDIRGRVGSEGNEQGLLGLAFHPRYTENGVFFVNYTDRNGDTLVSRFQVGLDPNRADPTSEQRLLFVDQPFGNHNGGHLVFGTDGYLYIGLGDGGSGGDPLEAAQDPNTLLGKLLRIDVDRPEGGRLYGIPAGNPFAEAGGLPEIFALGLRNPWRFDFDRLTGGLYIADVGQSQWEEVSYLAAAAPPGANFGWDYFEASYAYEGTPPDDLELIAPVAAYGHSGGYCSVTGGVVYRGDKFPEWRGVFMYSDLCGDTLWGLLRRADGSFEAGIIMNSLGGLAPTAFSQGPDGGLYVADLYNGVVFQLVEQ